MRRRIRSAIAFSWALTGTGVACAESAPGAPLVEIVGDSGAGYLQLTWNLAEANPDYEYQVEEATDEAFASGRLRYQGAHTASFVSGLPDGTRFYRVRGRPSGSDRWGPWSEPERFEVEHYSALTAFGFFGLGAVVFGVTAWSVVRGSRGTS